VLQLTHPPVTWATVFVFALHFPVVILSYTAMGESSNVETVRLLPAIHAEICANELGHCYRRMAVCKGEGWLRDEPPPPNGDSHFFVFTYYNSRYRLTPHCTFVPSKGTRKNCHQKGFLASKCV